MKNPRIQKKVFGRIDKDVPDTLEGYKKSKIVITGKTYPIIVPDETSSTKGLVISVTPEELELIDEYETDAYRRNKVVLKSGKTVWVYQK